MGNAVPVTDKDVLSVDVIYGTMSSRLECLFVAFKEEIAASIAHVDSIAVKIRTVNRLATTYRYAIIAL